jgi:hypothetical protein
VDYGDYIRLDRHVTIPAVAPQSVDVEIVRPHAYVACYDGLRIMDLDTSTFLGGVTIPYMPFQHWPVVVVSDGYAYFLLESRLYVVDTSDPVSPHIAATLELQTTGLGVALSRGIAYTAAGTPELQAIDIRDPRRPTIVGTVDVGAVARAVAALNDLVIVLCGEYEGSPQHLRLVDVATPAQPLVIGSVGVPGDFILEPATLELAGDLLYIADGTAGGLHIVDCRAPRSPTLMGSVDTPGGALDVEVEGHTAFVADGHAGLQTIDVRDPSRPILIGSAPPVFAFGLAIAGHRAYVATQQRDIAVIDVANPASPPSLARTSTAHYPRSVVVDGDFAYVAARNGGLQVFDIRQPDGPALVGSVENVGDAWEVTVQGGLAFVGDYYARLHVVDVTSPGSPELLGSIETPDDGRVLAVAVSGHHAFVAIPGGLVIFDVTDPRSPTIKAYAETSVETLDVAVAADHAYLATVRDLQVIDISDPSTPAIVGTLPGFVSVLTVQHPHAYLAANAKVRVVDVTSPRAPTLLGEVDLFTSAGWDIVASGDHLYVAHGSEGVSVFDVGLPTRPTFLGGLEDPLWAEGLAVSRGALYAVGFYSRRASLTVFPAQCDSPDGVLCDLTARLAGGSVELSWSLEREGRAVGFNVYRSVTRDVGYVQVNEDIIRGSSQLSFQDSTAQPGATYFYKLGEVDRSGHELLHGPVWITPPARASGSATWLSEGPHAFMERRTLSFFLPTTEVANLSLYDVSGRLIRELVSEALEPGGHSVTWDGLDGTGERVAGGTYFARLSAGGYALTRRIIYPGH